MYISGAKFEEHLIHYFTVLVKQFMIQKRQYV